MENTMPVEKPTIGKVVQVTAIPEGENHLGMIIVLNDKGEIFCKYLGLSLTWETICNEIETKEPL